ncbi:MAG: class I SAM-dependent methyltransferase [Candidatus Acetothermia bacterium]|jgi:SAM-dependent methyltransferase|nr:class I SAM-dependent methyltransferase [Candidatus Acetothermia bacterium]MDH7505246.1 class I SAM-dependent methyltransferase [Candidatus Acetothermia bacterium]
MPTWDELFKREEFRWREPYPRGVEFAGLSKERGFRRVLDLGCGTGRHLVYLAREGFEVCGIDISPTGLELARRWLEEEGLKAELKQSDMTAIPYPDGSFDGAISIHVIYHGTLEQMRKALAEIHRTLRPGGLALLTFQSKRSYRYGRGREIEPDTFIPDIGEDRDIPHHFSDREELEEVLRAFSILELELVERVREQVYRSSHWEVLVEKP